MPEKREGRGKTVVNLLSIIVSASDRSLVQSARLT